MSPKSTAIPPSAPSHHNADRVIAMVAGIAVLLLFGYVVIRNQPFADPNIVVALRIFLALAAAVFGATVPGFLNISWKGGGAVIRAGGALAIFALTFLYTPTVLPSKPMDISTQPNTKTIHRNLHDQKVFGERRSETFSEPSIPASQLPLQVDVRINRMHYQERADLGGIVFVVNDVSIINHEERRIAITAELYVALKGAPGSTIILRPHTGTLPPVLPLGIVPRFQPLSNIEPSTGASGTFVFIMERKTIDPKAWPDLRDWKQTPEISLNIIDRITQREHLFSTLEAMSGFQAMP